MASFIIESMIKIMCAIIFIALVSFIPLKKTERELSVVPKVEVLIEDKSLSVAFGKNKILLGAEYYNVWRSRSNPEARVIETRTLHLLGETKKYSIDIY